MYLSHPCEFLNWYHAVGARQGLVSYHNTEHAQLGTTASDESDSNNIYTRLLCASFIFFPESDEILETDFGKEMFLC